MKIAFKNSRILLINGRSLILEAGEDPDPEPPTPSFDEVTIGNQTWMAKNLSIDDGGEGIFTQTVNYGQGDEVEYYYTWDAAVRVAASVEDWHLPTKEEWNTLANAVGRDAGTKLKSTYGWTYGEGTDDYGFSAFPAGDYQGGNFGDVGTQVYFWSITGDDWGAGYYYTAQFVGFSSSFNVEIDWSTGKGNPVRLVKDSV